MSQVDEYLRRWWITSLSRVRAGQLEKESIDRQFRRISSNALFSAFALLATILEGIERRERRKLGKLLVFKRIEQLRESRIPFFASIYWTFIARFESVGTDKLQAELDGCGFTDEQQTFVWRWVRKEINLVEWTEQEEINEAQSSIFPE
jgi:hypothetical protein